MSNKNNQANNKKEDNDMQKLKIQKMFENTQ